MNLLQAAAIPFIIAVCGHLIQSTAQAEPRRHRKDAKSATRPSAATKHTDFEQEQTESTEAETTLLSVLSVISCSKNACIVRAI
jgi:hypothetical protein